MQSFDCVHVCVVMKFMQSLHICTMYFVTSSSIIAGLSTQCAGVAQIFLKIYLSAAVRELMNKLMNE